MKALFLILFLVVSAAAQVSDDAGITTNTDTSAIQFQETSRRVTMRIATTGEITLSGETTTIRRDGHEDVTLSEALASLDTVSSLTNVLLWTNVLTVIMVLVLSFNHSHKARLDDQLTGGKTAILLLLITLLAGCVGGEEAKQDDNYYVTLKPDTSLTLLYRAEPQTHLLTIPVTHAVDTIRYKWIVYVDDNGFVRGEAGYTIRWYAVPWNTTDSAHTYLTRTGRRFDDSRAIIWIRGTRDDFVVY